MTDVFGAVHLGYVVIETQRFTQWRRFAKDGIGLHVDELTSDTTRFRLDENACRCLLQRGPSEDVTALGWQIDDDDTFDAILSRLVEAGIPLDEGTDEECALRGVQRLWRFPGPKGMATEIFTLPVLSDAPLIMQQTGFVTGDAGMGHVAITSRRPEEIREYYHQIFDARLSDWIDENIGGVGLRIRFLRVNERHHSVAVAGVRGLAVDPIRTRVQHLNTQVETLDDLLSAYQRVIDLGFRMQWSIGQHTNDKQLSFYCVTPSGFEWELGWNPIIVTDEMELTWAPQTYQGISSWGHTPIGESVLTRLRQFQTALGSLKHEEASLPSLRGTGL